MMTKKQNTPAAHKTNITQHERIERIEKAEC